MINPMDLTDKRIPGLVYALPFRSLEKRMIRYVKCGMFPDLDKLNESCDCFVCGSDEIWDSTFNKGLSAYYLAFAKKYKFSFAASFGRANNDEIIQNADLLKQLNQIGLRESSSKELVEKYTGKQAEVVADPVLLLEKDEWEKIAVRSSGEKYILVYLTIIETERIGRIITQLQEKTKLKVKSVSWNASISLAIKNGIFIQKSPKKWLQMIRDAEYVITNSFHATVFSTIFQKKFFTIADGEIDKGRNVRMYDYLSKLGLVDRMLSDVPASIDLSPIDYTYANEQIAEMREHSLNFLKQNLEAAYLQKEQNAGQVKNKNGYEVAGKK